MYNMKKLLFLAFFLGSTLAQAQVLRPNEWSFSLSTTEFKVGDEIDLIFKATIDKGWHLYSSDFDPELGPMVTELVFESNNSFALVGSLQAINPKKGYDEVFEGDYTYFQGKGEFRQTIKVLNVALNFSGSIDYQVCTDETGDGRCIPFEDDFSQSNFGLKAPLKKNVDKSTGESEQEIASFEKPEDKNLWSFILFAFATGLIALLTPCVFPMIPMTVTFFLKENENGGNAVRKAIIFGISIILIFTVIGTLTAMLFGADTLNNLATHWAPNIFVFLIFFIFALSFLGLFEITLPSVFVNKMDQQSDRGGLLGVFFMAFTLALVSFSCTFPIVGSVLVLSTQGEFIKPIFGMLAFSLAFALPFTLFAIFPDWLKKMPQSGGWLNSVKVVLGLLELALGLKFLSIADQAYHWGILDREVYLALWIVIFAFLGLYLLGKIRLPHDSIMERVGVLRLLFAIATFSFVLYLIPGMWGAPLKALAGYLPPMSSHDFDLVALQSAGNSEKSKICEIPKYADMLHYPHGLEGYFDYDQAIACAREQKKPLFIDFTGHGCVNCREMEARVWSDPRILKRLKEDFVMVALYVDDRTELPESAWYTSDYDGKVKKTIGRQNADYQIKQYNNNAQPYYVILNNDEQVVINPRAYDLSIEGFAAFLEDAKTRFENTENAK
jgi:thiol:disulfide interchange protein